MEIERKFLVGSAAPDLSRYPSAFLRQGYLAVGPSGEVRIRDSDGHFMIAVKSHGGIAREEHEVAITREQFDVLWPATHGRRVEKRRFIIKDRKHAFQFDLYAGKLAGLAVVEVEFETIDEALAFDRPAWFGREVTKDACYRNSALALQGLPEDADVAS
ncbi:MAG: CYTH domain-containing protein [Coriobacteriia bacterium]|nr:CYTH domain-containing protein [Coriobacteriia bacterium]